MENEYWIISGVTGFYQKLHIFCKYYMRYYFKFHDPSKSYWDLGGTNRRTDTQTNNHNPSAHVLHAPWVNLKFTTNQLSQLATINYKSGNVECFSCWSEINLYPQAYQTSTSSKMDYSKLQCVHREQYLNEWHKCSLVQARLHPVLSQCVTIITSFIVAPKVRVGMLWVFVTST